MSHLCKQRDQDFFRLQSPCTFVQMCSSFDLKIKIIKEHMIDSHLFEQAEGWHYELLLGMRSLYNLVGIRDQIINRARRARVNNVSRESLPNCRETSYLIITIMSRHYVF